jgi:branched-chain amino acid transport system permease protein
VVWGGFAFVLIVAPLAFPSGLGLSMLSQVGIAIVACLSYNMLLGQGGMLSFGHAVYTGLGTFVAVHAMLAIGNGSLPIPVSLIPLVGGVAGMFFAVLLGYVTTKKAVRHSRSQASSESVRRSLFGQFRRILLQMQR